jgi:hypothetical protein
LFSSRATIQGDAGTLGDSVAAYRTARGQGRVVVRPCRDGMPIAALHPLIARVPAHGRRRFHSDPQQRFWDYGLESFTLMAGLAAVTTRIKLFASIAVLTMPPPVAARMAVTIDSIAPGRFGVNIVSGWQKAEYAQMGIWPGTEHFNNRYQYCAEYVDIMRELWAQGESSFQGRFFQMEDCQLLPMPSAHPGLRGVMLTFDDFIIGMEQFGTRIQPLMKSRAHVMATA